jgi:uncharacterized coiled-coil protein SlyX
MNHAATENQTIEELQTLITEKQEQYKGMVRQDLLLTEENLQLAKELCDKLTETRDFL